MSYNNRLRKGAEQQNSGWIKQNNINRPGTQRDLYKAITNQLSSQQFQAGELRGLQGHKRTVSSRVIQEDYNDQPLQQQPQNYYITERASRTERADRNSRGSNMINSNVADNYNGSLVDSKLHQTITEQVYSEFEKKYKKEMDVFKGMIEDYLNNKFTKHTQKMRAEQKDTLESIITQLNKNLSATSNRQRKFETGLTEQQEKMAALQKQFGQFTAEFEEKIEKLMNSNSNADIASSMRKSISRNMGNGDYLVELKSSIKQIPIMNNPLVEEIRAQISQIQQSIKGVKVQFITIKQELKTKTFNPAPVEKKPTTFEDEKFKLLNDEISKLRNHIQNMDGQIQNKLKQFGGILETQDGNLQGMNDDLGRVLNTQLLPRVKKLEQQVQSQSVEKLAEYLKKQVIKQLESMPIIRIRSPSEEEKDKIERMKNLPKSEQETYMLDKDNFILDCFGNYIVDENNQKIKLEEDQVYYLQQVEGIQIKFPAVEVK